MPDGQTRGMPSPTRGAATGVITEAEVVRPDKLYTPIGTEIWHDEFNDGSIDPAWTRTDASSSSYVTWKEGGNPGLMSAYHNSSASGSAYWHALSVPIPEGATHPLIFESFINGTVQRNSSYLMAGLAFSDGTATSGTNQAVFMPFTHGNDNAWRMSLRDFNNWNSQVSSWDEADWGYSNAGFFARIFYSAANSFKLGFSSDGTTWLYGSTRTITLTPTHVSLITTNWGGAVPYVAGFYYARLYDTSAPELWDSL